MESTARILIYSNDRFGLGHLRRCMALAHGMVDRFENLSVLIVSGSPYIGRFDFASRVDFVRIPGVFRPVGGNYTPLNLHISLTQAMDIRASIIEQTATAFQPDIFLVDNIPLGLKGEIHRTLRFLKRRGTEIVLGVRDVINDLDYVAWEWGQPEFLSALTNIFDHIWIYGLSEMFEPFQALKLPKRVRGKITYTGYLKRKMPEEISATENFWEYRRKPYLFVTTGGGGDGEEMIDWVIKAYECDPKLPYYLLIAFGPFMERKIREGFLQRIQKLHRVDAITFEPQVERLLNGAAGVISMGGYNIFCEILSLDKRSIIVPRTCPGYQEFLLAPPEIRRETAQTLTNVEQDIRATFSEEGGLIRMLRNDGIRAPEQMAQAIRDLDSQPLPSQAAIPGLMNGLENVNDLVGKILERRRLANPPLRVEGGSG